MPHSLIEVVRRIAVAAFAGTLGVLATAAVADDWGRYANARYGYAIDVPPDFVAQGESDNGDGQVFKTPTATLTVYGSNIVEGDFEDAVKQREAWAESDGWAIIYQVSAPTKASYSGKRGGRILYARLIALCGGSQFAAFELIYSAADLVTFDPIVARLVRSLQATEDGGTC
jgi:hypothetical protein